MKDQRRKQIEKVAESVESGKAYSQQFKNSLQQAKVYKHFYDAERDHKSLTANSKLQYFGITPEEARNKYLHDISEGLDANTASIITQNTSEKEIQKNVKNIIAQNNKENKSKEKKVKNIIDKNKKLLNEVKTEDQKLSKLIKNSNVNLEEMDRVNVLLEQTSKHLNDLQNSRNDLDIEANNNEQRQRLKKALKTIETEIKNSQSNIHKLEKKQQNLMSARTELNTKIEKQREKYSKASIEFADNLEDSQNTIRKFNNSIKSLRNNINLTKDFIKNTTVTSTQKAKQSPNTSIFSNTEGKNKAAAKIQKAWRAKRFRKDIDAKIEGSYAIGKQYPTKEEIQKELKKSKQKAADIEKKRKDSFAKAVEVENNETSKISEGQLSKIAEQKGVTIEKLKAREVAKELASSSKNLEKDAKGNYKCNQGDNKFTLQKDKDGKFELQDIGEKTNCIVTIPSPDNKGVDVLEIKDGKVTHVLSDNGGLANKQSYKKDINNRKAVGTDKTDKMVETLTRRRPSHDPVTPKNKGKNRGKHL